MDEKFSLSKVMAQPVHVFYTEVFSDRISTRVVPVLSLYRNQTGFYMRAILVISEQDSHSQLLYTIPSKHLPAHRRQ